MLIMMSLCTRYLSSPSVLVVLIIVVVILIITTTIIIITIVLSNVQIQMIVSYMILLVN